ncbi:unnamed protein product [Cuscuta epithymum]|uniref:Uncharacterized protein n=1 Tax=Cuscuta epithymum TaxID=186058 RepID=A0AAV0GHT0_9ASTE|nr:unnamed protein product [Cuscuta epithymum]
MSRERVSLLSNPPTRATPAPTSLPPAPPAAELTTVQQPSSKTALNQTVSLAAADKPPALSTTTAAPAIDSTLNREKNHAKPNSLRTGNQKLVTTPANIQLRTKGIFPRSFADAVAGPAPGVANLSFQDLCKNKTPTTSSLNAETQNNPQIPFKQPDRLNGLPSVTFTQEDVSTLSGKLSFPLIGSFLHGIPKMVAIYEERILP